MNVKRFEESWRCSPETCPPRCLLVLHQILPSPIEKSNRRWVVPPLMMKVDRVSTLYKHFLCCLQARPIATSRDRVPASTSRTAVDAKHLCELRQISAVSRCVSEVHEEKYRILEIYYPLAARKPIFTSRVEAYSGANSEAPCPNHPHDLPGPLALLILYLSHSS